MFIKLTHGLHNVINAIISYIQKWTDDSVPDGTKTLHNFKDGRGKIPAIPYDNTEMTTGILNVEVKDAMRNASDSIGQSDNIIRVKLRTELANGSDNLAQGSNIAGVSCSPEPIIFEIKNEVPDKIEKIVPIKTQALPGQDYVFKIIYVDGYNYIEGDIMPIFGNWARYVQLSKDGEYMTVNSLADLTVRLILTPAPQDWDPDKPDPSIIQEPTDKILRGVPRDGSRVLYELENSIIEDNFYTVSVENKATTFVTNTEFNNGNYYTVNARKNKMVIPMTFAEGFDEKSLFWKCYDDPKKAIDPPQGAYIQQDYNEGIGPLPNGFRKLQYLYGNGNTYIDLGIKLKQDYKVKVLMNTVADSTSSYRALFGARNSTDTDFYNDNHTNGAYACYCKYNYRNIGFQRGSKRYMFTEYLYPEGNIYWYCSTGTTFEVQKYDGTVLRKLTAADAQNIDTEWNCYLFTVNDKGNPYQYGAIGYMYRCEIYDENDNLIMQLIPAKDISTKLCGMYDIINDKFYNNKRLMNSFTGDEFYVYQPVMQTSDTNNVCNIINAASNKNINTILPEEYQGLYGVYSNASYLNTNYRLKNDDKIECCVTMSVQNVDSYNYQCIFGSRPQNSATTAYGFYCIFNRAYTPYYARNNVYNPGTWNDGTWNYAGSTSCYDRPVKLILEKNKVKIYYSEDESVKVSEFNVEGDSADSTVPLYLGCMNQNGSIYDYSIVTFHYFKIYDKDDNLVLDYIPAKRISDNAIGFYDTISQEFKTRTGGNYAYEERHNLKSEHKLLKIENIIDDINLGIIRDSVYDEPTEYGKDELSFNYMLIDSSILDYFYVVTTTNNATDYATIDASYRTGNVNNDISFTMTYKTGYDNYDIKCNVTQPSTAIASIGKTHFINYNTLDIPSDYSQIPGITNTNISKLYFKTNYFPKYDDKIECYCAIYRDSYYTYPSYVFGSRTAVNNRSFVFYGHRSGSDYRYQMGYDRSCGEKYVADIANNDLIKITADNYGCEVDFAYKKVKINTEMGTILPYDTDYNPDTILPDEYEKLSYVENTGSCPYVNLNFILTVEDKVEVIAYVPTNDSSYRCLFGARYHYSPIQKCYGFWVRNNSTNTPLYERNSASTASSFEYNKKIKIITDKTSAKWYNADTGEQYPTYITGENAVEDCTNTCYLFAMHHQSSANDNYTRAKIYSFKVYDINDNLIQHFVPARRKSDNAIGLYNVIKNEFVYYNTSSLSYGLTYKKYGDCDYEMYLFNCNQANSAQYSIYGTIYKFTAYANDGTIKYNFVPVKRLADNKIGFFDTINQVFFEPNGGTPTEASEPVLKGNVVVSNLTDDATITIIKNDNARRPISLEDGYEDDKNHKQFDELISSYDFKNSEIIDWFNTVKYINNAPSICSITGAVSTYYNVPRVGSTTRFPITYNVGYDNLQIDCVATAGANVEITDVLNFVQENVPDEYIKIGGVYNSNTSTYFVPLNNSNDPDLKDKPYLVKATDSIKVWLYDTKSSYTYYYFGTGNDNGNNDCTLCSRYENYNNGIFYSRNKRMNMTGLGNEVVMFDCKPTEITYTNGYDTYHYELDNTPTDSSVPLHIFGRCYNTTYQYHSSSFYGAIYKFQIYDDNGIKYNLIPVKRKVDGAVGFYDTVGDKFYLPNAGSVTDAAYPKLKGSIIVSNITDDTDITITEHGKITKNIEDDNAVESSFDLLNSSISDYWYSITINNTVSNSEITFTNQTYGNCYICLKGNDITLPTSYKSGYSSSDFIASEGTLTNNGIVLTNVKKDMTITVMLNDYHNPKSDTADDLNIFTNPDFSSYDQYRIIEGNDQMLTSFAFINSQSSAMTNREIYEFNLGEIDLLNFEPSNTPGQVKTKITIPDSNFMETVVNVTIDGKSMYKHTITLRNQVKLEIGKQYIFKVRDRSDTGRLIAYAKDTGIMNLVNSQGEIYILDNNMYFNWNEPNKYIVQGNKNIYFELNGIKL